MSICFSQKTNMLLHNIETIYYLKLNMLFPKKPICFSQNINMLLYDPNPRGFRITLQAQQQYQILYFDACQSRKSCSSHTPRAAPPPASPAWLTLEIVRPLHPA